MTLLQVIILRERMPINPSTYTPPPSSNPLHIENPTYDAVLCSPKRVIRKEHLIQIPMLPKTTTLLKIWCKHLVLCQPFEVLQNCPSQHRTLLSAIGAMDLEASNLITFNMDYFKERLSHHLAFQIQGFGWWKECPLYYSWMREPPPVSCLFLVGDIPRFS
jgi:hypothetical protein